MKRIIIIGFILLGCSSGSEEWDSGAAKERHFEQQRMEEQNENMRNLHPWPQRPIEYQSF